MKLLKRVISKVLNLNGALEYKRAKLVQKNGLKALEAITKLLEENDIYHWVDAGTLLGIVRDDNFIPNDTDIDIVVIIDNPDILYNLLVDNNYNIWYFYENDKRYKTLIRAEKYDIGIDFEIFIKENDKYFYDAPRDLPKSIVSKKDNQKAILRYKFSKEVIETIEKYKFRDIEVYIPKEYDKYFQVYYENWKEKEKKDKYIKRYFKLEVDKYRHHNNSAYYLKDKFLYFNLVNKSSIGLNIIDYVKYIWKM